MNADSIKGRTPVASFSPFAFGSLLSVTILLTGCTGPSIDALRAQDGSVGYFGREPAEAVASCLSDRLEEAKPFGSLIIVERHDDDRISVYETMPNTVMSVFDIFPGQWRTRVDVSVRRHLYRGDMRHLYYEITRDCLSSA
jgi:hypothetical protein